MDAVGFALAARNCRAQSLARLSAWRKSIAKSEQM
jgi:hypothetical protein